MMLAASLPQTFFKHSFRVAASATSLRVFSETTAYEEFGDIDAEPFLLNLLTLAEMDRPGSTNQS